MTDEEYLKTQRTLMRMSVEVQGLDLEGFLRRIGEAESAAPVLDPTLYRRGTEALESVKQIALAAQQVQAAYESNPRSLLGAVLDAYTREELAEAGIV